jgi:hypothetical protein
MSCCKNWPHESVSVCATHHAYSELTVNFESEGPESNLVLLMQQLIFQDLYESRAMIDVYFITRKTKT